MTPSNAGEERKGQIMGLDDDQFFVLLGCAVATFVSGWLFFTVGIAGEVSLTTKLIGSAMPLIGGMAYVYGFLRGKPPGYQRNVMGRLLAGKDFHVGAPARLHRANRHPLITAGAIDFRRHN